MCIRIDLTDISGIVQIPDFLQYYGGNNPLTIELMLKLN